MKRKNLSIVALVIALAVAVALTGLLAACGNNGSDASKTPEDPSTPEGPSAPEEPPTPSEPEHYLVDPALEIYSQKAHIGYEQSVENMNEGIYSAYGEGGSPAFVIPGLNEGENFVLQGVAYCKAKNWALLAGYIKPSTDHINSVVFVIDMDQYVKVSEGVFLKGALIKEILLDKPNGDPYTGHAGGIAVSEKTVWISNSSKLYYFSIEELENAPSTAHIRLDRSVSVPVGASYTSYADGILWVGEFEYKRDDYITDDSHHGENKLTAWTVGYRLDETGAAGYDSATGIRSDALQEVAIPDIVLWHGEKVQGMTSAGKVGNSLKVVLSVSYGRTSNSKLLIHDVDMAASDLTVDIGGVSVPCYILADPTTVKAPPMLEDLAYMRDGDKDYVLIACESGSYNYHGAEKSKSLYATDLIWKFEIK